MHLYEERERGKRRHAGFSVVCYPCTAHTGDTPCVWGQPINHPTTPRVPKQKLIDLLLILYFRLQCNAVGRGQTRGFSHCIWMLPVVVAPSVKTYDDAHWLVFPVSHSTMHACDFFLRGSSGSQRRTVLSQYSLYNSVNGTIQYSNNNDDSLKKWQPQEK